MYKKTIVQLVLILVLIFSGFFFYNEYKKKSADLNVVNNKITDKEFKNDEIGSEINILKNIKYVSKDTSGNIYEIYAEEGKIDPDEPDITLMKNVRAYISVNQDDKIEIVAKYAIYNNLNYNTLFRENIVVNYFLHEITCEKLDISFDKNLATFYESLVYESEKMKMKADKLEIDLITKNSKIIMFDTEQKISIVNKN